MADKCKCYLITDNWTEASNLCLRLQWRTGGRNVAGASVVCPEGGHTPRKSSQQAGAGIKRPSGLLQSRQVPVPTRLINEGASYITTLPAPVNANALTVEAAHQQKINLYESVLDIVEPIIGLKTGEMDDDIRARELRALKPLVDVLSAERVRLNKITKDKTNEKSRGNAERELKRHIAGVAAQKRTLERLGVASGSRSAQSVL